MTLTSKFWPHNGKQKAVIKKWAADDRLWTTQETVEINLATFAHEMRHAGIEKTSEEIYQLCMAYIKQMNKEGHGLRSDAGHVSACIEALIEAKLLAVTE